MTADEMCERLEFGPFDAVIFPGGTVNSVFELLGMWDFFVFRISFFFTYNYAFKKERKVHRW